MSIDFALEQTDLNNPAKIAQLINSWVDQDFHRKMERCMNWSEAINFLAGNQWITYSQREYRWEIIPMTDSNKFIDRPVTNHFLRWVIMNVSGFTSRPTLIVDPNSEDPEDKTLAKVCEIIRDYLWEEYDKDDQYYEAALWACITGTVFRKSIKKISNDVYETGGNKTPLRYVCPEIVSPFRLQFDGMPSRFVDANILMETQIRKIDDIKAQFNLNEPGYYPQHLQYLKPEPVHSNTLAMDDGLKKIVDGGGITPYTSTSSAVTDYAESCILKEVYVKPSKKYPRGLQIFVASDLVVYVSPVEIGSPYYYHEGKIWHPYTCAQFYKLPGQVWGLGLGQQLVKIQRRLNSIDALLAYNRKTMAVPITWAARGSNIPKGSMVGKPGSVVEYDPVPGAEKPHRDYGVPLPNQIMEERAMLLNDGNMLAMAGDIRSGDNPQGVKTVGQMQILVEQVQVSRSKQVESWEKFLEASETLDLLNFKSCYVVPQKQFITNIKKFSKDLTNFDWRTFTGSKIRDNATIRIEKGSTVPKSRILKQENMIKMFQAGLLGDVINDHYTHKQILEEFGLSDIYNESNMDVRYAEKTVEMLLKNEYPPFLPEVHSAEVQLPVLLRFMKDPKFLEVPGPIKILFDKKREEMVAQLAQAMPIIKQDEMQQNQNKQVIGK